jgi:hypothetical protein
LYRTNIGWETTQQFNGFLSSMGLETDRCEKGVPYVMPYGECYAFTDMLVWVENVMPTAYFQCHAPHTVLYCTQIRNGFQDCVRKTTTNKQRMVTLPVCGVLDLLCGPSPRQSEDRSRRNLCQGAEDREGAERVGERGNTSVENSHPNNAIVQASSGCATSSASLLQIWVKVLYAQDVWDFQGITKQCVDDAWLQGLTSFGHYLKFA